MKKIKKPMAIILCMIIMLGIAPLNGLAELDLSGLHFSALHLNLPKISLSDFSSMFSVRAKAASIDDLTYRISDGKVTITGCDESASGELIIPETIEDYPVTIIGYQAFSHCTGLTSVTIPDSVTMISNEVFSGCTGLKNILIPNSVTYIGIGAFSGCSGLTSMIIPRGVTYISEDTFCGCSGLTSITIPDSVTNIEFRAFFGCTGLTSIIIPNSVTSINDSAFRGCSSLKEITLPFIGHEESYSGISAVFGWIFGSSSSSSETTYQGKGGYYFCIPKSLRKVTVTIATKIPENAFYNCSFLTEINLPNSVTRIGDKAFYSCTGLKNITIPDSVTSIGSDAFYNCPLEYVKMGSELTDIPTTLIHKDSLKTFIIGDNVTSIGYEAFSGCTGLTSVTIGNSVTSIGDYAFRNCIGLTSISIPNSVTSIGDYAFRDCTGLTSITIPDSVTSIGSSAFDSCPLEYVKMGSGLTDIPSTLINKDSLKTFIIGDNITSIGDNAFSNCTELTSVTIGNSVTSIGNYAFRDCTGLTNISIPNSVTSIGSYAFSGCTSLTSIIIPGSITSISNNLFNGCTNLATITLPDTITRIGSGAFNNTAYYNNTSNWSDNMLYIGKYLISGRTDLAGNKSVKSNTICIADSAFYGCDKIITLTVPTSVKYIGSNAFFDITNVAYTGTATGLPWGARCLNGYTDGNFVYSDSGKAKLVACSGLATGSVVIPASTDTIGNNAFSACSTITNIYIPVNVTRIGNSAFSGTALSDVYYEGSTVDKLGISFGDNNSKITDATWHYNSKKSDMPSSPTNPDNPSNPDNPPSTNIPEANIIKGNASNNQKTYNYKTTVTFTANVPSGGKVQWYVDGKKAGTDSTLTVKDSKESYTVKVVVTDKNGNQTMDEEQVTIKNGFFDKLIWFFVHLFNPGAYDVKQ